MEVGKVLKTFETLWAAAAAYTASDIVMKIMAMWERFSLEDIKIWINQLLQHKTPNVVEIEVIYSIAIFYLALSITILTRKIRQEIEWG